MPWVAGQNQLFDTPFGRAIASICYESAFAQHFRRQAAAGGQLSSALLTMLITANNACPTHAQDVMRAVKVIAGLYELLTQVILASLIPAEPSGYLDLTPTNCTPQRSTGKADFICTLGSWLTPLLVWARLPGGSILQATSRFW